MERLNKLIAQAGIASRRGADDLISAGRVGVNGSIVRKLGVTVNPATDEVTVDGKALPRAAASLTYAFYKPRGIVTSTKRQAKEKIVTDFLPNKPTVYPVGRLDKDSEGLLLMTNDGELANRLTHPSFEHEKEYLVICRPDTSKPQLSPRQIAKTLLKGVKLGDGLAKADQIEVSSEAAYMKLRIVVHEGRMHLIRRMCAQVGLHVIKLERLRIGHLTLHLKPGTYQLLMEAQLSLLND